MSTKVTNGPISIMAIAAGEVILPQVIVPVSPPAPPSSPPARFSSPPPRREKEPGGKESAIKDSWGTGWRSREAGALQRADAFIAEGQTDKALLELGNLIAELPQSTFGHLRMATLLRDERRTPEALKLLRTALAHRPDNTELREALAEICLEMGRWTEAILHARQILARFPRSIFPRDILSAVYLQRGLLDKALAVTTEMIHLEPRNGAHHFKCGVLLQQKGCIGAAVLAFSRVLDLGAEAEVVEESCNALEMLDAYQMRQILTLAVEDIVYRTFLCQSPAEAVAAKGFLLSDNGLFALSQVSFENLPESPSGWRHFGYQ